MGIVYLAHHWLLRRPTALKLLPPEKAGEHSVARFEREVQQTSLLTHPNTVAIYDFARTRDGILYYVMEYLDGLNLDELIDLDGPQPPGRTIHVLTQVAHALAEAHDAGLVQGSGLPRRAARAAAQEGHSLIVHQSCRRDCGPENPLDAGMGRRNRHTEAGCLTQK
jgi:serine/threonine protein kinase